MAHAADHGEVVSPTPAQDLELAQRALDEGDAAHAAHHLAGVLGVHPLQRGVEEAISRWLASVPGPLALVPIPVGGVYRGLAALRAFALRHAGRPAEACGFLLEVQASAPELPFAEHLALWLATVDGRPGSTPALEERHPRLRAREIDDPLDLVESDDGIHRGGAEVAVDAARPSTHRR
jgi:hypothetical protein